MGVGPRSNLLTLSEYLWFLTIVLWVVADSHGRPEINRPYEYGFLVYVFLLAYAPYYLIRTRRFKGLLLLGGLVVLSQLSWLTEWALYYVS